MSRRHLFAAVLAAAVAVPAAPATATRTPTAREGKAIRAAALRTLHGGGWRVSHIRVSTAATRNRYASADVTNRATGVGGSMLLGTRDGRWARRFLGTDGFCEVSTVPRAVLVDLYRCPVVTIAPTRVAAGASITVSGRNWPASVSVELLVGPPRSEADPVGSATTTTGGRFTVVLPVDAAQPPGRYVLLGCLDSCRTKASAAFTVIGGSP